MSDAREREDDAIRMSEDAAHRVLARAIELEQDRETDTTVAQLREVAREAGISMQAFEAALREGAAQVTRAETQKRTLASGGFFTRLWRRVTDRGTRTMSLSEVVVTNLAAGVLFWLLGFFLTRFATPMGWQAMQVTQLVTCMLGVGIARAMRARIVAMGMLGFVAWLAAELSMHLLAGNEAVQGGPTHFAVMIAGLLGVVLGWRFGGEVTEYASVAVADAATENTVDTADGRESSGAPQSTNSGNLFGLRLGAAAVGSR